MKNISVCCRQSALSRRAELKIKLPGLYRKIYKSPMSSREQIKILVSSNSGIITDREYFTFRLIFNITAINNRL